MERERIPRNAKDIIQKIVAEILQDALIEWYGIHSAPIVAALSADVPVVTVQEHLVDSVFLSADGTLLHLEFQSSSVYSLGRFAQYSLALALKYQCKVRTLVIYLYPVADPREKEDYGDIQITVSNVFIASKDAQAVRQRLNNRPSSQWTAYDDLDLAFFPFMTERGTTRHDRVREVTEWLPKLDSDHRRVAAALLVGLTGAFLDTNMLQSLKEVIRMNDLIRELEQEAIDRGITLGMQKGIEQGIQQGRLLGQRQILLHVLEARFGVVSSSQKARIESANPDALVEFLPTLGNYASLDQILDALDG
jgi:hypothetical protein